MTRSTLDPDQRKWVGVGALRPVLATALDAVIVMGVDGRVLDWNVRATEMFGWPFDEAVGRTVAELIIPKPMRVGHWAGLKRCLETGEGKILGRRLELPGLTRDGREIPVELAITQWRDRGQTMFVGFLRDLTGEREAAKALQRSEQRLRATQENAGVGIAETDDEGRYLTVNTALCDITGYAREELLGRKTFFDLTHPDDRAGDEAAYSLQVAGGGGPYMREKRYLHADGHEIWVSVTASAVYDEKGQFLHGIRVIQNISERKATEERVKLLMNELTHRVKNTLALVTSISVQTGRHSPDPKTFNIVFAERLKALARSQDLLVREGGFEASLRELLLIELSPYRASGAEGRNVALTGPPVRLDSQTALNTTLAVHELATNAAKYGALSSPGGTVEVVWRWADDSDPTLLDLVWVERGGPPVTPPSRKGFGSRLIERLSADLGGAGSNDYRPEGLVATIRIRALAA